MSPWLEASLPAEVLREELRLNRLDESGAAASPADDPALQRAAVFVQRLPRGRWLLLSPAERRVLVYLCAGYPNKAIAHELGRAEPTIKHQISGLYRKLGVQSRGQLWALMLGAQPPA